MTTEQLQTFRQYVVSCCQQKQEKQFWADRDAKVQAQRWKIIQRVMNRPLPGRERN